VVSVERVKSERRAWARVTGAVAVSACAVALVAAWAVPAGAGVSRPAAVSASPDSGRRPAASIPASFGPPIVYRGVPNNQPFNVVYNYPGGSCWVLGQEGGFAGVPYGNAAKAGGNCLNSGIFTQIRSQWEGVAVPRYSPFNNTSCQAYEVHQLGPDHPAGCSETNLANSVMAVPGSVSNPIHGNIIQTDIFLCSPNFEFCQNFRLSPFPLI
jgi:hypothetical protein